MAKKAKSKWTEGVLARDPKGGSDDFVVFFAGAMLLSVALKPAGFTAELWRCSDHKIESSRRVWLAKKFRLIYGLDQAPRCGHKRLVDIEL